MRVSFRQGIVRYQTDVAGNPTFLRKNGNTVDLVVSPDPTRLCFADGTEDYLHDEKQTVLSAWSGPFLSSTNYYLYVDIDQLTAVRTFGQTTRPCIVSRTEPTNPAADQHWFDLSDTTMKVRDGKRWVRKIRVFVGSLSNGSVLRHENVGSQVGLSSPILAGYVLYDGDNNPVIFPIKQTVSGSPFNNINWNRGRFLTTESRLASQMSDTANFTLESVTQVARARAGMAAFTCIRYLGPREITYADPILRQPAVGLINEDAHTNEIVRVVSSGFLEDENFFWTQPPGTPLFVGTGGALTTVPSQSYSIQQVGVIVSPKVIQVAIGPFILYI